MDATDLPAAVEEYLWNDRAEPFEFAETLAGCDGQDSLGRTAAAAHLRTDFGRRELTVDPAMDEIIKESVGFYEPDAVTTSPEAVRHPLPAVRSCRAPAAGS